MDTPNGFLATVSATQGPLYAVQNYVNRALQHTRHVGIALAFTDRALAVAVLPYSAVAAACVQTRSALPVDAFGVAGDAPLLAPSALHVALQEQGLGLDPAALPINIHYHVRAMVDAYSNLPKIARDFQNEPAAEAGAGAGSISKTKEAYVLLTVTKTSGSGGDMWALSLPGGKRKLGESAWADVVRESWEECLLSGCHIGFCETVPAEDRIYSSKKNESTSFLYVPSIHTIPLREQDDTFLRSSRATRRKSLGCCTSRLRPPGMVFLCTIWHRVSDKSE
jgi:hypothetical protein